MTNPVPFKLSPSAINTFLRSPKAFYWSYVQRIEPVVPSVSNFDHDKLLGILWAEATDRFYKGVPEAENVEKTIGAWDAGTDWVPTRTRNAYRDALVTWLDIYHKEFSPDDGVRNGSEKFVENERFKGYLDGLSHDRVVHEVKSTKRSPQLDGQLWRVQNSLQVKLYCVLTNATGIRIEFAFKDSPYGIYRSEIRPVTEDELVTWEHELNALADRIYSLGTDPNNYPCTPDNCCLVTKGLTSMCGYYPLCSNTPYADTAYKPRTHR